MLDFIRNLLRPRCTWDELIAEYLQSSKFRSLAPATQASYRRVLMRWVRVSRSTFRGCPDQAESLKRCWPDVVEARPTSSLSA